MLTGLNQVSSVILSITENMGKDANQSRSSLVN